MVMPDVLNSNVSSSSSSSNNLSSTMINNNHSHNNNNNNNNNHHHHHHHHHHPMSSLSTTDEYSSRYSSLQDTESLKSAILDSFRMHWIQAWSIMECKILNDITIDDLSSIVNHIEQMISLLVEENVNDVRTAASMSDIKTFEHTTTSSENNSHHSCGQHNLNPNNNNNNSIIIESSSTSSSSSSSLSPLLEFLSSESILEKIFQWSEMSGEWKNAMYLEQLKLYDLLISELCQTDIILFKQSFFQPLIYLLDSLSTFLMSNYTTINNYVVEIEKRLVILLNTLCVIISQNNRLLNLFIINGKFYSTKINNSNRKLSLNDMYDDDMTVTINHQNSHMPKQQSSHLDSYCDKQNKTNEHTDKIDNDYDNQQDDNFENVSFPLFSLLIQFVHRDGPIGQQARDAILLCLAMSRHDERLAYYVANKTDFCPILATGLSGHFSSLPRVLIAANNDNHQPLSGNNNNNNNKNNNNNEQYQSYQFKHELLSNSKEIDHFLKCLDFCNAVVQMSHPIIQVQLLKFTFNGFLISVIGPALHQNTLDEIITTTAYLDLFIRTTSEPKLIRIFLEFLCFEVYDNNFIISTLINRITAKSKLSLVTLIFFKTLLDLNCEDLLYELIFKHLMRGRHLKKESHHDDNLDYSSSKHYAQNQSYRSYQKNWLAISAQKLLSTSISYYLNSLCPHQAAAVNIEIESISSFDSNISNNCKCHSGYFLNYLNYLNDARQNLEQCHLATKTWRNSYHEPCHLLNEVQDENIIFCTIDRNNLNGDNNNNNNNDNNDDHNHDDCGHQQQSTTTMAMMDEEIIDINDIITQNTLLAKFSPGFKMKNCYYDLKKKKISYKIETNKPSFFGMMNIISNNIKSSNNNNNNNRGNDWSEPPPIGSFLSILFMKFEKFFENEVITNLHLTGLLTRLCHFPHKLLLSLLFDETLSRTKNVPCFLHLIQKLSLEAQNYCDEIPDFETVFQAAKSNLQSMPLGEVECSLLLGSGAGGVTNIRSSNSSLSKSNETNEKGSQHKAFGMLKNFFFRSTNSSSSTSTIVSRRPSNASIVSSTGQMLEVVPGGIRFINQTLLQQQRELREQRDQSQNVNRFNQLVYNIIVFDEFLMELSAILIEHSLRYIEN
ncbi:FHIP family protein AGAP011705 isoform X2 [Dermatophagoides farinae]|uniref:FHIP family protein AGAP011705 isoform X2 n=1 Tax=Dermatophagoides farinae TaxID=6954 RepID=UPI003F63374E